MIRQQGIRSRVAAGLAAVAALVMAGCGSADRGSPAGFSVTVVNNSAADAVMLDCPADGARVAAGTYLGWTEQRSGPLSYRIRVGARTINCPSTPTPAPGQSFSGVDYQVTVAGQCVATS